MAFLNELKQYAVTHFAHEEAYMADIHDPELPRQQKEHQAFVDKVNSYRFSDITDAANEIKKLLSSELDSKSELYSKVSALLDTIIDEA